MSFLNKGNYINHKLIKPKTSHCGLNINGHFPTHRRLLTSFRCLDFAIKNIGIQKRHWCVLQDTRDVSYRFHDALQ